MYCHGSLRKSLKFPRTFLFMPNKSSEQVLESFRRIEKVVEFPECLNLAHDIIVVS